LFCQRCGYTRKRFLDNISRPVSFDLAAIDLRIQSLKNATAATSYSRQKTSLKEELRRFLFSLPDKKDISSATPADIVRFLVYKDVSGKTRVHSHHCPDIGQNKSTNCDCPLRLSYNTVDSYIGKLRSIFNESGRQGDWNDWFAIGNPASGLVVKQYLKAITAEQLQARVIPRQATPLFIDKLSSLAHVLEKRMLCPALTPSELFVVARDQALFKTMFFSGDRAGDLGRAKTIEIARFPADDGLLFHHVWGKTLRDGGSNLFGIRRHPNPLVCPVRAIETYMAVAHSIGIDLRQGHLFRPTTPRGTILDKPLLYSTAESRLKFYLDLGKIDEGETLHSFRSGCALTLAFSGSSLADVMTHVGWQSSATASYYMKLADVLRAGAPADLLASAPPGTSVATHLYSEYNHLKNFVLAFPPPSHSQRKRPLSISEH